MLGFRRIASLARCAPASYVLLSSLTTVESNKQGNSKRGIFLAIGGTIGAGFSWLCAQGEQQTSLPQFTADEVARHKNTNSRIWVTYKDGVYDITEFVALHPGGSEKIMLAAGGAVDPFWNMYQQHRKDEVRELLEEYKIGTLVGGAPKVAVSGDDPYANEPSRHPVLIPRTDKPFNGETPLTLLAEQIVTPTELFYVRNHLPVPSVDTETYRLKIEGEGLQSLDLTLEDIKTQFPKHTITASLQCAGNRRTEMKAVKDVKGVGWEAGAMSTATFTGALLRDVLTHAGFKAEESDARHVQFVGLDQDKVTGQQYGASIPIEKALSEAGDVLLAYEMNGEPLTQDHGAPLRVVVPGHTGARSVKWLASIRPSRCESDSFWQQKDYKCFSPGTDWDTVDWAAAPAIQETPVISAICSPSPQQAVAAAPGDVLKVKGYSFSGGGRSVIRVDVSADNGGTWVPAQLQAVPGQHNGRAWAWTLWEAQVEVPEGAEKLQLVCKAVDAAYNTQPESVASIWNLRGLLNNAWHRVTVPVASA